MGKTCEDVFIDEITETVISDLEPFFPNGGIGHDNIKELAKALLDGKIRYLSANY